MAKYGPISRAGIKVNVLNCARYTTYKEGREYIIMIGNAHGVNAGK